MKALKLVSLVFATTVRRCLEGVKFGAEQLDTFGHLNNGTGEKLKNLEAGEHTV
jgi:hypothetical protein